MDINTIINILKKELDPHRFDHSLNVMETAEALAKHYGADVNKARLAGILHDCGKNYKGEKAIEYIKKSVMKLMRSKSFRQSCFMV